MKKRLLAILMVGMISAMFALTGCTSDQGGTPDPQPQEPQETQEEPVQE